jgi:hypothetical protein
VCGCLVASGDQDNFVNNSSPDDGEVYIWGNKNVYSHLRHTGKGDPLPES